MEMANLKGKGTKGGDDLGMPNMIATLTGDGGKKKSKKKTSKGGDKKTKGSKSKDKKKKSKTTQGE